jgi:fatty acid desaturase
MKPLLTGTAWFARVSSEELAHLEAAHARLSQRRERPRRLAVLLIIFCAIVATVLIVAHTLR